MIQNLKRPSVATIFCTIFLGYVGLSIWNLVKLFQPPFCSNQSQCFHPILRDNPKYELVAYTSTKREIHGIQDLLLLHHEQNLDYHKEHLYELQVPISSNVRNNGTMDLHVFIVSTGTNLKNLRNMVDDPYGTYRSIPLIQYEIPKAEAYKLLGDMKTESSSKEATHSSQSPKPFSHFRTKINIHILTDDVSLPKDKIDYDVSRFLKVNSRGQYLPILHIDTLTLRAADLVEIKPDTQLVNLSISYAPMSFGKLRLGIQVEAALDHMKILGFTSKDVDEIKGLFSGVNLYILCITFMVSAIHLMFDFLAFKNDISFWRGLDTMNGISPSTVAWRAFAQVVIFLYLMEEKTSVLVLAPNAVGSIIEFWKVTKAFHIRFSGYRLHIGRTLTKAESDTQALDSEGFKYLTYIIYPLCACGAIYSLLYTPHKSWYSWVIQSLVNGVYAFGFLFMLPQLFINYKLKSVAHLPWRAFMYKAFNTFIDDVFAFIITMPTAHRVACFRDDIVFIIYLYQKWLYPVDKSRVNEYGQKGEDQDKKDK